MATTGNPLAPDELPAGHGRLPFRRATLGDRQTAAARLFRHDPKPAKQVACRAPMKFAAQLWPSVRATVGPQWPHSPHHSMMADAVRRWLRGEAPSAAPGNDPATSYLLVTDLTAAAAAGLVTLRWTAPGEGSIWGVAIIRSPTPIDTPSPYMLRAIYPLTGFPTRDHSCTWTDRPPHPGTWHYRLSVCEAPGWLGTYSQEATAVVG